MFVYNCTPHSSTGFTPYYLYFGHDARLPIDNMLSIPVNRSRNADDWMQIHQHRMQEALKRAKQKTNQKAQERKERHDRRAMPSNLKVGSKVLLRNRVLGRNKIQDIWSAIHHTVVGQLPNDSSAILVQRSTDGKVKVVNRLDVLPFSIDVSEDDHKSAESNHSTSDSDSSSDGMVAFHRVDNETKATPVQSEMPRRRPRRANAGQHSNPHHVPRSVLKEEMSHQTHYMDYCGAIIQLGQLGLSQIQQLGKLLQESYENTTN